MVNILTIYDLLGFIVGAIHELPLPFRPYILGRDSKTLRNCFYQFLGIGLLGIAIN